jgi:hypothetical protein
MADIFFRRAAEADLPAIVALLADDPLGQQREQPGPNLAQSYRRSRPIPTSFWSSRRMARGSSARCN